MSIRVMTQVWNSAMPTPSHKLVTLALADFANDKGEFWPSTKTVAVKSQVSQRQVQRVIADLKRKGWLIVVKSTVPHRTPTYRLLVDRMTPLPSEGDTGVVPRVLTTEPSSGDTQSLTGDTVSPKPSGTVKEPSDETAAAAARASSEIFALYEQHIGPFDPFIAGILAEAESDYSEDCIRHAFQEASRHNKRNWAYVEAILKVHKQEGCYVRRPKASRRGAQGGDSALRRPDEETAKWKAYATADG